jgi:hypothetical protein
VGAYILGLKALRSSSVLVLQRLKPFTSEFWPSNRI